MDLSQITIVIAIVWGAGIIIDKFFDTCLIAIAISLNWRLIVENGKRSAHGLQ